jgi:hypothetical protein
MATAKRLYLYGVSAVSLGLVLYAASILAGLLFDRLGMESGATVLYSTDSQSSRESLSLAIGLIAVGLPAWLVHWSLTERMVTRPGPSAAAERQSIVRAVYVGLVLLWLAIEIAAAGTDLLREAICRPLGATALYYSSGSLSAPLAWLLIGSGAFAYHGWIRARDLRLGPTITGAAAWWSRLAFYGFAAGAVTAALFAAGTALGTLGQALTGYSGMNPVPLDAYSRSQLLQPATAAWWVRPVVTGLATALVYGAAWFGHWWYAVRLADRTDQQGLDERASRVRLTYFVWIVAVAVSYALFYVGESLSTALRYVVGAWYMGWGQSIWGEVAVPLVTVLPLTAGWAWHRRRAIGESRAATGSPLRAARPLDYVTSFIGLVVLAPVMIWFLAEMIQQITGPGLGVASRDDWRSSAADAIGLMVAAAPFWLWPWLSSQRRLSIDRIGEATSTARRAFLFAVSGLAVAAAAISAAFIVYRLTRVATGLDSTSFGSDVRVPLCAVIVAVPLLTFHAFWLRRDLGETREAGQPAPTVGVAEVAYPAALPPSAQPATSTQELVIDALAEADLEPIRAWLVAALPVGYTVSVRSKPGTRPD